MTAKLLALKKKGSSKSVEEIVTNQFMKLQCEIERMLLLLFFRTSFVIEIIDMYLLHQKVRLK